MRMTVMIQPLVLTLINRKVKADKDYNLSYIISFLKINKKNSQWWTTENFVVASPHSHFPYQLSIFIKYFTF